jgi:rSAM/selenodomain-associated transferase 2
MGRLSIVVPVLDEAAGLARCLKALAPLRARGVETIVVDGGSTDGSPEIARPLADRAIAAPRGRGSQMHAGARAASGDVLLFLHGDTMLPPDADRLVAKALAESGRVWGRFDIRIEGRHPLLKVVAAMINWRTRAERLASGDQAMFVTRAAYEAAGGFPDIPLMEDLVLAKALRRIGPPAAIREKATTSGRRWEANGVARVIVLMWIIRLRYALGADVNELARVYGYRPRET